MSKINHQFPDIYAISGVSDLEPESAAAICGGATGVADVTLFSGSTANSGEEFATNKAVKNLADVGFNDATGFIAVNNGQTWRFYEDANFKGDFIDVGPDEARRAGKFAGKISSLRAID
jgi:hypothetical protein